MGGWGVGGDGGVGEAGGAGEAGRSGGDGTSVVGVGFTLKVSFSPGCH